MNAKGCGLILVGVGIVIMSASLHFCQRDASREAEARHRKAQSQAEVAQHFARAHVLFSSNLYAKATAEYQAAYEKLEVRGELGMTNFQQLTEAVTSAICSHDYQFGDKIAKLYLPYMNYKDQLGQYLPLYLSLSYYASGNSAEAKRVGKIATQNLDASEWPYPIAMYLADEIASDELLRMAGNKRSNLIESHCHIAFRESANGNASMAVASVSRVIEHGEDRYSDNREYRIVDSHADRFSREASLSVQGKSASVKSGHPPEKSVLTEEAPSVPPAKLEISNSPAIKPNVDAPLPDPDGSYAEAERVFEVENWSVAAAEYVKAFRLIGDRTPEMIRYRAAECALLAGSRELADIMTSTVQPRATHEHLSYSINLFVLSAMLGDPSRCRLILEDAKAKAKSDYWPYPLLECCLGERNFQDVVNNPRYSSENRNVVKMVHGFYLLSQNEWKAGMEEFYEGTRRLSEPPGLGRSNHSIHVAALRAFRLVCDQKMASGELKQPTNASFVTAVQRVRFFRHNQFPKLLITRVGFKKIEYCGGDKFSVDASLDWESDKRYSSGKPMAWGTEHFLYEFELDNSGSILGGKIVRSGL
jgi:hypothetical protein